MSNIPEWIYDLYHKFLDDECLLEKLYIRHVEWQSRPGTKYTSITLVEYVSAKHGYLDGDIPLQQFIDNGAKFI